MTAELVHALARAARGVRAAVAECDFPLPLPAAAHARRRAAALLAQLDDYLLPRLAQPTAPLLMVVGGPTGAGKSTLVNSLVRAPVSAAGALRPTTRIPTLVCHPSDGRWLRGEHRLAGMVRDPHRTGSGRSGDGTAGPATGRDMSGDELDRPDQLPVIAAPALPPGLALVDAPDIDSVVARNRAVADRLLAAADMWLFVTTPGRYADAVPWRLLRNARDRGAVVALVLARVPPGSVTELTGLVADLLASQGLADLPVLVVPQSRLDRQGLLPEQSIGQLRTWLDTLARDETARASVIGCTLDGALSTVVAELTELAAAADQQRAAAEALAEQVGLAYGAARGVVERGVRPDPAEEPAAQRHGPLPLLTRRANRLRPGSGRPRHQQTDTERALVTLVRGAVVEAADRVEGAWRGHPAGEALLADGGPRPSPDLHRQVLRIARERPAGTGPDRTPTGADDDEELLTRMGELLDGEAAAWLERLGGVPLDGSVGRRLREAASGLDQARQAARLTEPGTLVAAGQGPAERPGPDRPPATAGTAMTIPIPEAGR